MPCSTASPLQLPMQAKAFSPPLPPHRASWPGDSNRWPSGLTVARAFRWQRCLSALTARQLNTPRPPALRRSAMTRQVCTGQIFTLYCLAKCTYCMSSCSLKPTDSGTLTALLSLVSSFHQFTPPLRVLSGPYTKKEREKASMQQFNQNLRQILITEAAYHFWFRKK